MTKVTAYTVWNTTKEWEVESIDKAREFAKRMIMEGLWYIEGNSEVFIPPHNLIKVKIQREE